MAEVRIEIKGTYKKGIQNITLGGINFSHFEGGIYAIVDDSVVDVEMICKGYNAEIANSNVVEIKTKEVSNEKPKITRKNKKPAA